MHIPSPPNIFKNVSAYKGLYFDVYPYETVSLRYLISNNAALRYIFANVVICYFPGIKKNIQSIIWVLIY